MRLIDNRYKIEDILDENYERIIYIVSDLWNDGKKSLLKLYKPDRCKNVINYFINNFIYISSIKHKYLQLNGDFNIVKTIDNKKISLNQYYYTAEYTNRPTLDKSYKTLSQLNKLNIILELCTVLDYLHYRGMVYRHLSPTNIFIDENHDIKLKDLATINENIMESDYDDFSRYFIAPELIKGEKSDKKADFYSFGQIIKFLFNDNISVDFSKKILYKNCFSDEQINYFNYLIDILTKKELEDRNCSFREIILRIKELFNITYDYSIEKEREVLNFKTKMVGRNKELEEVLSIDNEFLSKNYNHKVVLLEGEEGVGKTRFLKEVSYVLRMKGRNVIQINLDQKCKEKYKPISDVLRQVVKYVPKKLIDKYGSELVKILPDLRLACNVNPSNILSEDKERLRLFDRLTSFIQEIVVEEPTYLLIDNMHNCDDDTLKFISYIVRNIKDCPLLILVSYNTEDVNTNILLNDIVNELKSSENNKKIKLVNLDMFEIGELIQNILGIDFKPIKLSDIFFKETAGNPRYIELVLKNMYTSGDLFINDMGVWELKGNSYSDIYLPSNINEAFNKQLSILNGDILEVAKIISAFNGPVSKNIILQMIDISSDRLNQIVEELVSMRIFDERLGDWGYSYTFYNIQLKKIIYHNIEETERQIIHKNAAKIIEKEYGIENQENFEELIYHLVLSMQEEKAVDNIIAQAKKMQSLLSNHSIIFWEKAYELLKGKVSIKKLEVMLNMGQLYTMRGENEQALNIYNEILNDSQELQEKRYFIDAKNAIGEIYYKRNEIEKAYIIAEEANSLAKNVQYSEGYLQSLLLIDRIELLKENLDLVLTYANEALNFALAEKQDKYLGHIYNNMGIVYFYNSDFKLAESYFQKSVASFQQVENYFDSAKPINNIGYVYASHYGNKEKAMAYYNEGLNISQKYGNLELEMFFLNNIGEIYIGNHDYIKAKEYIEKAKKIASETENKSMLFITSINLGQICLIDGKYDASYNCFKAVKEEFEKNQSQSMEVIGQYYNFLSEFYYKLGEWEKALKCSRKAMDVCGEFNIKQYIMAKSRIILIEYFWKGYVDKAAVEEVRKEFKERNLGFDRRKKLLQFSMICCMEKDYDYAKDLLKEDEKLKGKYTAENLEYVRNLVLLFMGNGKDNIKKLIDLEENMKINGFIGIDLFTKMTIGDKCYSSEQYYQSINYYLEALDTMYLLAKRIPDKELQISYIKSHGGDRIKERLAIIFKFMFNKQIKITQIDDLREEKGIDKYFDLKGIFKLIDDKDFLKIAYSNFSDNHIAEIDSVENLMMKFTDNSKENLLLILSYMGREVLAQNGYIYFIDEENHELIPMASLNKNHEPAGNDSIISLVSKRRKGIIIKSTLKENENYAFEKLLNEGIKAVICIPIVKPDSISKEISDDRRKDVEYRKNKIVGYIYLETNRLFNRFDFKRYKLIKSLSNLVYMNIENYNLKIISSLDKMTGTFTRKYFDQLFGEILDIARLNGEKFTVLMVDIDKFKNINDNYGHQKGDEVLSIVGDVLVKNTRATDIVARYGGEEFIVVLRNTDEKEAYKIADKIRKKIQELNIKNGNNILTISTGISVYPKHSQFKEELIGKADQALYCAKEQMGNKVIVWNSNIGNTLNRMDRLAGIITGNTIQDQRNALALTEVIDLVKEDTCYAGKVYDFLGRILEIVDANYSILIVLDEKNNENKIYARKRFEPKWIRKPNFNRNIVNRVILNKKGEFLIDWETISDIDVVSGTPNWQSIIAVPLIYRGIVKGAAYLSVPIKEKEFDYNSYNLINTICSIFATLI